KGAASRKLKKQRNASARKPRRKLSGALNVNAGRKRNAAARWQKRQQVQRLPRLLSKSFAISINTLSQVLKNSELKLERSPRSVRPRTCANGCASKLLMPMQQAICLMARRILLQPRASAICG